MSSTDRQNRLLVAEDWKRIYQSYRNADFQSYDFDNLRRTMINYLRTNYPEDFNDYIESSEYLALIDLIAFLGQNISFRIDLNARENFLELAERRESVLRLARLLSYNPKRNQAAEGLLKIASVNTTEDVIDSNNFNLAGQQITWNDPSNTQWYEQFIKVLNAALPANGVFGRPTKKEKVNGIQHEQYRFNAINTDIPKYAFSKTIEGQTLPFEVVSSDIVSGALEEEIPIVGNSFAMLYKNDGQGPASTNTGFFTSFKQGSMDEGQFSINNPSSNQKIDIDATDINNKDVWLFKLDENGRESEYWTKVSSVEGNNVIYNSLNKNIRNLYSVLTRVQDRISLVFSDGVFGNLPTGRFKAVYRTSANKRYTIKPSEMTGIEIDIPYLSAVGIPETLSMTLQLRYTISNSSVSESDESIKANAPATYYTQNRMITAEDYNVAPLGISQEIVKVKTVNRNASGISRYFDLVDSTGKYSSTNLFGNDGVLYKETKNLKTNFNFVTTTDIEQAITNTIEPIIRDRKLYNYYLENFTKILITDLGVNWNSSTQDTNRTTGYITDSNSTKFKVGTFTANNLRFIEAGTLIKFVAPAGYHFMTTDKNKLMEGSANHPGAVTYIWTKVISVTGDGTIVGSTGLGPVVLNDLIPSLAILEQVKPKLTNVITDAVKTQIVDQAFATNTFGLRYDVETRQWRIITETNIDSVSNFSTGKTGDSSNQNLDASWLLYFKTDGERYDITYRTMRYVFESDKEIKFYYDSSDKIYDNKTGKVIKDKIEVLNINNKPDVSTPFTSNYNWEIVKEYRDAEGYVDSKRIEVSFFDADDDGVIDNPQGFDDIVDETTNASTKFIFQKKYSTSDGVEDYRYVDNTIEGIQVKATVGGIGAYSAYTAGQIFFTMDTKLFYKLDAAKKNLTVIKDYRGYTGRAGLKFRYLHSADYNQRIDPSASNIMDSYLLTRTYDIAYRQFLQGNLTTEPLPPSSDEMYRTYGVELGKIKSISDEIIYHPVKYKPLFGTSAETSLQATFKVVVNSDVVTNNNDVKSRVIEAINVYFNLDNWEFGESFYFSELSTYIMNQMTPDIVSIVIVPNEQSQSFGSLFEIKSESNEVFISSATVENVEIIDGITASRLKATGNVITASQETTNTGVTSTASQAGTISSSGAMSSSSSSSSGSSGSSGGGYSY
jgi:hypothetical protein|tara:strand:+ start:9104 stop:12628 length:3525 start_codon:yes stop_codon:yes gene_type:complete